MYLRNGTVQTIVGLRVATLRQKLQIKFAISPSHRLLTSGQAFPVLTLGLQVPGRTATWVTVFEPLV